MIQRKQLVEKDAFKVSNGDLSGSNQDSQNKAANSFHQHHHYYYLNNNANGGNKLESSNSMSKSIDSIYSPSSSSSKNLTGNGAFNPPVKQQQQQSKDLPGSEVVDAAASFQPVNFTQNRPKQINVVHHPASGSTSTAAAAGGSQFQQMGNLQQSQNFVVKASNFKRDIIAEKKRSSIGKFPNSNTQNGSRSTIPIQHISQFQPIQIQHIQSNQPNQSNQSARERLFGQQHLQQNLAAAQAAADLAEQMNNNRKVALVKPELRETCENDMINRFTQQNQMEYFDTDYCEEIVKNVILLYFFVIY
jgi:hypothetical protein